MKWLQLLVHFFFRNVMAYEHEAKIQTPTTSKREKAFHIQDNILKKKNEYKNMATYPILKVSSQRK